MPIQRILVPIDFSDDSLNALTYAREFAAAFDAELLLLHVIEPIYYATPADMYVTSPNISMLLDEQRAIAEQQLERLSAELSAQGRKHRTILKTGTPAQVIVEAAEVADANLIIMSTHGRSGLAHILLGSVAEKIVRHATCPVLTIRRVGANKNESTK